MADKQISLNDTEREYLKTAIDMKSKSIERLANAEVSSEIKKIRSKEIEVLKNIKDKL